MIYIRITREMLDTFISRFRYAMEYLICHGDRYVSKYTLYVAFISKVNSSTILQNESWFYFFKKIKSKFLYLICKDIENNGKSIYTLCICIIQEYSFIVSFFSKFLLFILLRD